MTKLLMRLQHSYQLANLLLTILKKYMKMTMPLSTRHGLEYPGKTTIRVDRIIWIKVVDDPHENAIAVSRDLRNEIIFEINRTIMSGSFRYSRLHCIF